MIPLRDDTKESNHDNTGFSLVEVSISLLLLSFNAMAITLLLLHSRMIERKAVWVTTTAITSASVIEAYRAQEGVEPKVWQTELEKNCPGSVLTIDTSY